MDISKAVSLIVELMEKHGLFTRGWSFEWDRAKSRCGQCRFGSKVITISQPYVEIEEESEVRDTILHEIAHALVGPGHHHDWVWRMKAREIGARPERCSTSAKKVPGKYVGHCLGCGVEIHRYRKPKCMDVTGFYSHTACKRMGREAKIEWRKAE